MFFRDLLKSSRLEIITSKRFAAILYGVFALAIFLWWLTACYQFISAYTTTGTFDVSVTDFTIATLFFFTPLLVLGCFIVATLLQRYRLRKWYKSLTYYPFYESELKPAEAGLLVDQELNKAELHATLLDLHYKDVISINFAEKNGITVHRNTSILLLSEFEKHFLETLFESKTVIYLDSFNDQIVLTAGITAQEYLIHELSQRGLLLKQRRQKRSVKILAKAILYIGGCVGIANILLFIFMNDLVTGLGPDRYSMQESQIYLLLFVSLIGLAVALSGLLPRFNATHKDAIGYAWLEAEGFRHYLDTLYRDRFNLRYIHKQEPLLIKKVAPFMVAYKIIPLSEDLCRIDRTSQLH